MSRRRRQEDSIHSKRGQQEGEGEEEEELNLDRRSSSDHSVEEEVGVEDEQEEIDAEEISKYMENMQIENANRERGVKPSNVRVSESNNAQARSLRKKKERQDHPHESENNSSRANRADQKDGQSRGNHPFLDRNNSSKKREKRKIQLVKEDTNVDGMEDFLDSDEELYEKRKKERRDYYYEQQTHPQQNRSQPFARNRQNQPFAQEEQFDDQQFLNVEEMKGRLAEWIHLRCTQSYIKKSFVKFIQTFRATENQLGFKSSQEDTPTYFRRLQQMCISNSSSFLVSYNHLKLVLPLLSHWLASSPSLLLPQLNLVLYGLALKCYPAFSKFVGEVNVRIEDMPIMDHIRSLRFVHLGQLIRFKGVVTVRSETLNQMKKAFFSCIRCGEEKGPVFINSFLNSPYGDGGGKRSNLASMLGACRSCQSAGPFTINRLRTLYRNYQKINIQESPNEVLPGRIPRSKECVLLGDSVDLVKPGEEVEIIGIYATRYEAISNIKIGFPIFHTFVEVNHIKSTSGGNQLDQYSEKMFVDFAGKKNLPSIIFNSIAPSIYGHQKVKRSLTLAMFSGVEKQTENHRTRGDINILLLGDPGVAKSQFLKSLQRVFYRCIYTTGKGASAVGLTASVKKDPQTGQFKLQAGALVIADKGICLIDQFDKMSEADRTSIHEAMQQQSISISKAGIVTSLRARCSVIAAANPLQGRYNSMLSFKDNVDLSDPIISRFDVLNVMKDQVDEQMDNSMAIFVINSHMKHHPYRDQYSSTEKQDHKFRPLFNQKKDDQKQSIGVPFLRQYIRYARDHCRPVLSPKMSDHIKQFYSKLRQQSITSGGIAITPRHLESVVRVSEAHAKMHLRKQVLQQDVSVGVSVILESFIQTQKHSVGKAIRRKFYDYLS